jgi:hypothetical protein
MIRPVAIVLLLTAATASAAPLRFTVTQAGDSGPGSLREAVETLNAGVCAISACAIGFDLGGQATIALQSPLPAIRAYDVLIDGEREIAIDGGALSAGDGFDLEVRGHAEIAGLTIRNFPGNGILFRLLARTSPFDPLAQLKVLRCVIERNQRGITLGPAGWGAAQVYESLIADNVRSGIFLWAKNERGIQSGPELLAEWNWIAGNGASGIFLDDGVQKATIAHNVIEGNHDFGVAIAPQARVVRLRLNRIAHNGGGAIDIGLDGPNREWPFLYGPRTSAVLESATYDPAANTTTITGTLDDGTFCQCFYSYGIALYANDAAEHGEYAEAETFLGETQLIARRFVFTAGGDLRGKYVTALPTRWYLFDFSQIPDTLELSKALLVR